jgi:hypothetical protein
VSALRKELSVVLEIRATMNREIVLGRRQRNKGLLKGLPDHELLSFQRAFK